jgi:hypothetical protein
MGIVDRLTGSPRDRFAAEALRLARRAPDVVSARYERESFAIVLQRRGQTSPAWLNLSNVYGECAGAPKAERRRRVERLLRILTNERADRSWESVRPKLRPVLRPATFGQVGVTGMVPPISRAALPHLREFVVVDEPESMSYVTPPRLEEWGVQPDEVFAAARENLEPAARQALERHEPGERTLIRMVDDGDGYFTSLLLSPGWLAGVSRRRGAPIVAFIPDTNTVMLCDVPDTGLGRVYELIEREYREAVRDLSPVGYVADSGGAVVPYAPPPGDLDHAPARRAEVLLALSEYGAQQRWLSQEYEKAGMDVYVAELMGAEKPGGPPVTYTTWTDGISSLLPGAQFVSFVSVGDGGEGGVAGTVPWSAVADLIDLRPEPLLVPVRYRVDGWPPPAVMQRLLADSID